MSAARYARQTLLPQVGRAGQERLAAGRVVVMGAGGLGAPVLHYLVAAGVGHVVLVDDDVVEESNLHRQVLFAAADVGHGKAETAARRLRALNPEVTVVPRTERIDAGSVAGLVEGADVVVDGTDNFATRYLVNDACALAGLPLVWASILRFDGQLAVWWAGHGPCYRCVFGRVPRAGEVPSCAEGGVLGPVAATLGSLQATEVLKLLLGVGEPLVGRLLVHDALTGTFGEVPVAADPDCPVCGRTPTITRPVAVDQGDPEPETVPGVTAVEADRLHRQGRVHLVDVRGRDERDIAAVEGALAMEMSRFESGAAAAELPDDRPLVLLCRSGARSARAVRLLAEHGRPARSLTGGLLAWADEVDPTMPRY